MHERPILLTGATGYIGSRLLRELEAGGYAVRCLARQPAGVPTARETFAIRPTTLREAFVRAIAALGLLRRIEKHAVRDSASLVVGTRIGDAHQRVAPRWAAAVALVAATTLQPAAAHPQTPPVRAVPFVDLDRYAGDWFEIARFPNRFQRQCVGDVRATYARRPDGRVDVVNRCRVADGETEARGVARVVDERTFAKLKVRFAPAWLSWLPMVWGDYWIIGLAPDYFWAVVGDPGRDYLWILARAPDLDDDSIAAAQAVARDNGFDVDRLMPTSQAVAARP